ncbi:MAG TPA: glutamine amidotransferase family protein [Candidatus Latescibacteria bacterium]|nr:glutamine amidotransferase family protein [Candidatus Latescibacterota bacterium]
MPSMRGNRHFVRRPHQEKDISACGIIGFINRDGTRVSGDAIIRSIANMHDRGNGLGGGFAAYGIYPEHADAYALHIMYDDERAIADTEALIRNTLETEHAETIPVHPNGTVTEYPEFRRYFCHPPDVDERDADEYMVRLVMRINAKIEGAYVVSSGRNMGAFKGVGFPEDLAEFFCLQEYEAYLWTAHNRFPTNTPGWWGGAHPFTLLDWSIVHNGEISSYGINRRYLESFGYACTLMTDTEVVAYIFDLLVRRHGLSFEQAATVMAPPFWQDIDRMPPDEAAEATALRQTYASAALNGPFAFLFGYNGGLIGLNDRVKLRPLVVAERGDTVYMASEESAIRVVSPDLDTLFYPVAGQPVIARLYSETAENTSVAHGGTVHGD